MNGDSKVKSLYLEEYKTEPDCIASAPGVLHLMGEQIEFAKSYVLGMAVQKRSYVALGRREDHNIVMSTSLGDERKRCTLSSLKFKKEDRWANYIKGVLSGLDNLGCQLGGLNIQIHSDIPAAKGLASSSALCIAAVKAICSLYAFEITDAQAIYVAYTAETQFMDQVASISSCYIAQHAHSGAAFALDLRSLEYRHLRLFSSGFHFYYCDSGVAANGAKKEYLEREEIYKELRPFLQKNCGKRDVRDISWNDLNEAISLLPEEKRRICLHASKEEDRTHQAIDVLESGQVRFLGKIQQRSHESLRDLYDVSCPEIDWLVKHGIQEHKVLGGRLSGYGLGGPAVLLVQGQISDLDAEMGLLALDYEHIFGFKLEVFRAIAAGGVSLDYEGILN